MGEPELSRRRRLLVLAVCCSSLFIVGTDATIVNIALPSIQRELHATVSGLQWTVDAYTIVVASFLMLSGSTADRIGRRRTFQAGLGLFTLGSLLCSLAPGLGRARLLLSDLEPDPGGGRVLPGQPGLPGGGVGEAEDRKVVSRHAVIQTQTGPDGAGGWAGDRELTARVVSC